MGCANSLIFMELHRLGLLKNKRVIVFEPLEKKDNDRTFCFWLEPEKVSFYGLNELISHHWSRVQVNDLEPQYLGQKKYYFLRAEALYAHTKQLLLEYEVHWQQEYFQADPSDIARIVFDSRPPVFKPKKRNDAVLHQSFFGWFIKTEAPVFDPSVFTMMDFSIAQNRQTQFLYILPFDGNHALIEPTRFGKELLSENDAAEIIGTYLSKFETRFEILEKEQGCIAMTSVALESSASVNCFRTGTGGGQLKPSTGYSFVRSLEDAQMIGESLQKNEPRLKRRIRPKRFVFYDRLLLQIIERKPERGKEIFTKLFYKNDAIRVLNFLDESTTMSQELRIMGSLPILLFLFAAIRDIFNRFLAFLQKLSLAFYSTLLLLFFNFFDWQIPGNLILLLGLFSIGIPHGALDHLLKGKMQLNRLLIFMVKYIGLGIGLILMWKLSAPIALIVFLLYTAWHFGQADFEQWQNKSGFLSACWGLLVLTILLLGHFAQTGMILTSMGIPISGNLSYSLEPIAYTGIFLSVLISYVLHSKPIIVKITHSLIVLFLGFWLPLLWAFGIYFIFQHSVNGWLHLRKTIELSNFQMWIKALPFSLGALALFGIYMAIIEKPNWGQFFIFLSALSFPHVWFMHLSYPKK